MRGAGGSPPLRSLEEVGIATAYDLLWEALYSGPQAHGLPVATWGLGDLQALLRRERGRAVRVYTVHRAVRTGCFTTRRT